MLLIYVDESGINWGKGEHFWNDGPYILWTGIFIPENKYFHVERMFYDLGSKLLGVKDWQEIELHGTDIWNKSGNFSSLSEGKIRTYFDELFQLLSKLKVKVVLSVEQKNPLARSSKTKRIANKKSLYAFLHGIEYELSTQNETGILIADSPYDRDVLSQNIYSDFELLVFDRVKWRYNPGASKAVQFKSKYEFESKSCFILDQLHYAQSKKSLFIQLVDNVSFVLQRILTYRYLLAYPAKDRPLADKTKVPIPSETFSFYSSNIGYCHYDAAKKDIIIDNLHEFIDRTNYLDSGLLASFTPYK